MDSEYIDISPSSTLIKQYQVCLCNTSHVYILINLFDLCQHLFLHWYIHFLKCSHMLNDKGNVSFCHHLASVVCRPSSANFSHQVSDGGSGERASSFLHSYIHFFKCWHMLNEPFILSSIIDWSIVSTDRKTYLFSTHTRLNCITISRILRKKSLKIPKGKSEFVYQRRTYNTMAKRKSTNGQTTI